MAVVQNSFNRYKTVCKRMTSLTKNIDKCARIREEFRLLIIPLMQKAVNDNPSDLVSYCARYFEDLLMEREEKIKIRENKRSSLSKDGQSSNVEGSKNSSLNQNTLIQSSTSLPILTQKIQSFGPPLRETSSWSNPSDSSQKAYRKNIQFDIVDAMTQFGDQPDRNKEFQKRGDGDLHQKEQVMGDEDIMLSCGDKRKKEKNEHYNSNEGNRNTLETVSNDACSPSAPSHTCQDIDKDLCALVNIASSATSSKPSSNSRKKWSIHNVVEGQPKIKPISSPKMSDSSGSDSDDWENTYERFQDVKDEHTASAKPCTSSNSSFGFIPQLQDSEKMSQTEESEGNEAKHKDNKEKTTPEKQVLSAEDIECCAQSIFQTLRKNLENELRAAEAELNLKLKRFKTSNGKGLSDSQSQMPPRKKRSITTFSTCKADYNSKERDKAATNDKTSLFGSKSENSSSNCNFESDRQPELNIKETSWNRDDTATESSLGSTHVISTDTLHSNQQNVECKTEDGIKTDTYKSKKKNGLEKNEGIVNPGFSMEDDSDRAFMKRISFIQQQFEKNKRCTTEHLNRQRNIRSSNNLPTIRPTGRSIQSFYYPGRTSSYTTPILPNTKISNIGEGDVLPHNQIVCSIGTETENSQINERFAGANVARILPIVDTVGQNSRRVSRENVDRNSKNVMENKRVQNNPTASIGNLSKGFTKTDKMDARATDVSQTMGKSQNAVQESNPVPKDPRSSANNSKENGIERRKSDYDINGTKKISNLNPCAPVFSPNSRSISRSQSSKRNESSEIINRPELEKRKSSNNPKQPHLVSETDIRIDAVAWDCLRSESPQGHENITSDTRNGYSDTQKRTTSRDFGNESTVNIRKSEPKLNGSFTSTSQIKEIALSGTPMMENKDTDSDKNDSQIAKLNSQMKMAEGDRIPFDENGGKEKKMETKFKQEEPCLSSACGDFVPTEDNNNGMQPSFENGNTASGTNSDNLLVLPAPSVPESENDSERVLENLELENKSEEIEVNFACLTESDSSDCYSSDMSEEDFSGENNFEA